VVVLFVRLEVLGEPIDPLREDGDLNFGRTGVRPMGLVGHNSARLYSFGNQPFALLKKS
jgi:hypothetical protein